MALFAFLFGLLRAVDAPPIFYVTCGTFCAAVGLGQALFSDTVKRLFPGALVGGVFSAMAMAMTIFQSAPTGLSGAQRWFYFAGVVPGAASLGMILGIVVGTIVTVVIGVAFSTKECLARVVLRDINEQGSRPKRPVPRKLGLAILLALLVLFCLSVYFFPGR